MTPPGWKCDKRIGYLFPHPCNRLTPVGCQDCQNGQVTDPYIRRTDRYGYSNYDYYDDSLTGYALESLSESSHEHDFTEADGESMVMPDDSSYESDLSAS
jgi:hypothetical protein